MDKRTKCLALRVVAVIIAAFLVYFAVMLSLGRERKLEELRSIYGYKPSQQEQFNGNILTDSAYLSLLKEKAYLQSKTLMAETDSIYLAINLQDSISEIEISGVTVHSARISFFSVSSIIKRGDRNIIFSLFSQPLTIDSASATIRKEPIMVKIAPKDTSEYEPDIAPDTTKTESVNYLLEMTDGTRIIVYQEETIAPGDLRSRFVFDMKRRIADTWSSIKSIAVFKVPEHHPYILIKMPREDARIIYRALPRKGQIAVYT